MARFLEEMNHLLLQLTLMVLHLITYGFIIWSVLCHHGIIDCEKKTPGYLCLPGHRRRRRSPQKRNPSTP